MLRTVNSAPHVELSLVIPVYNSLGTLGCLVEHIHDVFAGQSFEVLLVNDGSSDGSAELCDTLAETFPGTVCAVHLDGNFGEHNAVMAGLRHAAGRYVAVLDDDGQNPPQEILRMWAVCKSEGYDVVYGRPRRRQHSWFRCAGSWFHNQVANLALGKPRRLYLSSFKVMRRTLVARVIQYAGPRLYLDHLVLQAAKRIGQIEVQQRPRQAGKSGYTLTKLVRLWLNMVLGASSLRELLPVTGRPQYIVRQAYRCPLAVTVRHDAFTVRFGAPYRELWGAETGYS